MKTYNVKISVGDKIAVGKFRNSVKTIKAIELDENKQPIIVTSAGKRKLLNFKLVSKPKKAKKEKDDYGPWNGIV
jgi:hypothetical protein